MTAIATDPRIVPVHKTGSGNSLLTNAGNPARLTFHETRNGLPIKVVTEPMGEGIITAYPTRWPELKPTRLEIAARNELALATSKMSDYFADRRTTDN